ncbi:DnaT-like ssDNA-binding domain-containing protein [Alteromonas sp. CYL-A6]|uniref:DnaT-like ssDNA-binding domain-containing protein n=1 Tax=Alteromonas nitratireducens TaxID=3390813 RepID=UPI0034AF1C97
MNDAELTALSGPLSNDARVLYCLGLRPGADKQTGKTAPLDYRALLTLLNADDKSSPYQRGRQINSLLKILHGAGLISLLPANDFEHSLNGEVVILPLSVMNTTPFEKLHRQHIAIDTSWRPDDALYDEITGLLGLIDNTYDEQDVGEFIAYWLGRPDAVFSLFQWTQKFAYSIRKKRLASGYAAVKRVGSQQVKVEAGVEADDNARKLVEKYANKKPKTP